MEYAYIGIVFWSNGFDWWALEVTYIFSEYSFCMAQLLAVVTGTIFQQRKPLLTMF